MGELRFQITDSVAILAANPEAIPSPPKPSEIELATLSLFDEFRNPLMGYVIRLGLSVHDAEEVTQDVFLSLFRHLQMGKSRSNLRGWIFRVGHNLALKKRFENQKALARSKSADGFEDWKSDSAPNPEEQLYFKQRRDRLLAVFHALPENDQCCLRLRAEGLRYREIAGVLDISLGSVSISLTRSLARLLRADGR